LTPISRLARGLEYLSAARRYATRSKEDETIRIARVRQVVLDFANGLGFIAREAMSREELEQKIDSGISAEELASELRSRIEKIPGIVLGQRPNGNDSFEIKLPFSLRDRHCYLIGRSGSGKTNLIRTRGLCSNGAKSWDVSLETI
jgi:hypothetical protein